MELIGSEGRKNLAEEQKYGGMNNIYSQCTELDDMLFIIRTTLEEMNTAMPVKVVAVYAGGSGSPTGYVDVLPLVGFVDMDGNMIDMSTLYHLPYFRLQGGIAAIVTDPVVGDIGLAVFTQRDSTNVVVGTKQTVRPGSFRKYSISDGFYIGGFLNQKPKIFLELKQDETADLTAQSGIVMNVNGGCTINANSGCTINASGGGCTINGNTTINGNLTVTSGHYSTMNGNINVVGGEVDVDGVTMKGHVHSCPHGGETSPGHG